MRKIILLSLIVICAVAVIHAFFLPWARASLNVTRMARGLSESAASGALENAPYAGKFIRTFNSVTDVIGDIGDIEVKTVVSGYDIPALINSKNSKVAISVLALILNDVKDLDKKSKLVYLMPIFAIVCIVLGVISIKNRSALIALIVLSGVISTAGLYNLMTVNLPKDMARISIGQGLWQTMYAYLLICVMGIIWIATDIVSARKAK